MLSCGSCNSTTNPFAPTLAGYFGESRICAANLLSNWRVRVPALNGLGRTESKESVNVDLLSYTDSSMPESPLSSAKPRNASQSAFGYVPDSFHWCLRHLRQTFEICSSDSGNASSSRD